ncbi:hypothetical protein HD597_009620 [Nonomuraea thailandensis]|uniref:Uncharacterized protein n=1 Tax=Nonomuraea thailandensis TaxID=1188745 RepID=A0A9X2GRH8_9ACTN|nr:hypothetical protein [Nonomuraea thailandensis]
MARTRRLQPSACARPSLSKMALACFSTALRDTCRRAAMDSLVCPCAIRASTSCSRTLSRARDTVSRARLSSRRTTSGSNAVPPLATRRSASRKSPTSTTRSFSR